MQPLPLPVDFAEDPVVAFELDRVSLVAAFGAPHHRETDPLQVPGPRAVWAFAFRCGLELLIDAEDSTPPGRDVMVMANSIDPEHIMLHLPKNLGNVWISPQAVVPTTPGPTILWRQDDNGVRQELGRWFSSAAATCALASLERLHHKQTYWLSSS